MFGGLSWLKRYSNAFQNYSYLPDMRPLSQDLKRSSFYFNKKNLIFILSILSISGGPKETGSQARNSFKSQWKRVRHSLLKWGTHTRAWLHVQAVYMDRLPIEKLATLPPKFPIRFYIIIFSILSFLRYSVTLKLSVYLYEGKLSWCSLHHDNFNYFWPRNSMHVESCSVLTKGIHFHRCI